jgi:[ribosomal protein S5]-alanine N-acetyltransferase
MARSPDLQTARLRIIPFDEVHLTSRYVSWLNDPEVVRFSEQRHRRHTLESCRSYWQSFADSPNYFWALVACDERLGHVGNMNAYVDPLHGTADVGILIGERALWGQGYGLEAWQAVCGYLEGLGDIRKITAGALSVNLGMLRLMRKANMVEDGRRVNHYLWEGEPADLVHMARFRKGQP